MSKQIAFVKLCYWIGAAIDGVMLIPMLIPRVGGAVFGIEHFKPGTDYKYAMAVGASLMLGWTCLLIWGSFRPSERRGVLLLTAIPVVLGLALAGIYAVSSGLIPWQKMLPTWVLQGLLMILFISGYLVSRPIEED